MFVVKGTSLIPSHQYSVQRFLQSFLFYPYSISTPPSSFSFQSYFLFFNSFILHFYTSTAVDTCSLRLRIFNYALLVNDIKNEFILIQARGAYIGGGGGRISEGDLYRGGRMYSVLRRAYDWVASKWGLGELISGSLRCGSHFT